MTNKSLQGRTALVTGASGEIGAAIAIALANEGANLALHYHRNECGQIIETIQKNGGKYCAVQADLGDPGFETGLLDRIENQLARPDILVNCAASQTLANIADMPDSNFSKMMQTNLNSVFALSREFANRLEKQQANHAAIVNISSIEATRPAIGHGHYATSKAALEMLTKSFALEYGHTGMRVNAVAPGLIVREGIKKDWPEGVNRWNSACPLGRMGTPGDVANAVVFLTSGFAGFINGTVLTIDGGMSATPGW